jgi:hydroxycarboxylate dehydrogenase B
MTRRIAKDPLVAFVRDIFAKAGCSESEAQRIGTYLVSANLTGHDSHGVQRVPRYLQWLADGDFKADVTVKIESETPVLAVVDGGFGFGQTVAPQAVDLGIKKAKAMGLSAIALKHAGHIGRVGDWAERAIAEGLVSIHFVNVTGSSLVAPYGSVGRIFSTAPYCIGVPRTGTFPLVLDFATSIVAEGKVLNASYGGKKIPSDALIAPDGGFSGDPHTLYGPYEGAGPRHYKNGTGAIRAFGEHKGSGLAFMCEILGGALTGNGAANPKGAWANGMLSFYIDPAKLDPKGLFPPEVERFTTAVKTSKSSAGAEPVLVPGELEHTTRQARIRDGIPLPDDTWTAIVAAAKSVGVPVQKIPSLT